MSVIDSVVRYDITCKQDLSGTATLFDPTTVAVHFASPSDVVTSLTYGGAGALDGQLQRSGVGLYNVYFHPSAAGTWQTQTVWTDSGITCKSPAVAFVVAVDIY